MEDARYSVGASVTPIGAGGPGRVIERRRVDDGKVIYGVLSNNGQVAFYTADGIEPVGDPAQT